MRFEEEQRERLDRALRVIGQGSAREGMEDRILRGIEAKRRETSGRRTGPAWWAMGVAAAALMAAGAIGINGHRRAEHESAGVMREKARMSTAEAVGPSAVRRGDPPAVEASRAALVRGGGRVGRHAWERSSAVSFPAPAAPLTEQERLLRAVADAPQRQAVEALDPVHRAAEVAEVDRVAKEFFEGRNNGGYE